MFKKFRTTICDAQGWELYISEKICSLAKNRCEKELRGPSQISKKNNKMVKNGKSKKIKGGGGGIFFIFFFFCVHYRFSELLVIGVF